MNCQNCCSGLQMTGRLGVEVDHCLNGRGVWLDRGEPGKILDRHAESPQDL